MTDIVVRTSRSGIRLITSIKNIKTSRTQLSRSPLPRCSVVCPKLFISDPAPIFIKFQEPKFSPICVKIFLTNTNNSVIFAKKYKFFFSGYFTFFLKNFLVVYKRMKLPISDMDPDPAKSPGSLRILIHNTGYAGHHRHCGHCR
jgi:hypothetical protein